MRKEDLHRILEFDIPEPEKRELKVNEILALMPTDIEIDNAVEPITGFKHGGSGSFLDEIVRGGINWFKNFKR